MDFAGAYARLDALEDAEALLRQAEDALHEGGETASVEMLDDLRRMLRERIRDGHEAIERRIARHGRMCYTRYGS